MEKVKLLWSFLIYKILYRQDPPEHKLNRQWRHWIGFFKQDWFLAISYELQLTQFEGRPMDPRPVVIHQIGIQLNPKKWKFSQDHIYYDGNHCNYDFGPIQFHTSGSKHCPKCYQE